MISFIILGITMVGVFLVLGYLFFMLDKEGHRQESPIIGQTNQELKTYLITQETYTKRIHDLEEELLAASKKAENQNQEAQQMIAALLKENESLKNVSLIPNAPNSELEILKKEKQDLETNNAELNQSIEALQHEVIKLRAQSTGLERVSFNYKNQLEDFLSRFQQKL